MNYLSPLSAACHWCARVAGTVALWSLWLALALALAVQLYVASTNELTIPAFVLRRVERRLAEAGLRATAERTSFDPTGRALIENLRLSLPEFSEPVITARAAYVQFNPWSLLVGRFEPREIRLTGAGAAVPAMLSRSGRSEEMIRDLDATLVPAEKQIGVTQLSAWVGNVAVSARGAVALSGLHPPRPDQSMAEIVSTQFPRLCREAMAIAAQLDALDQPELNLEFAPSDTRAANVKATLFARGLTLETPLAAHIGRLRIVTRLPLLGDAPTTSRLELVADELRLPLEANARGVRALLIGRFRPGGYRFEPRELQLSIDAVESSGFAAEMVSAQLTPQPLPHLTADIVAEIMGAPIAVQADADFSARSATLRFAGAIAPGLLEPVGARLQVDVRKYFDFAALECSAGEARLGPGWKFEKLTARVALQKIDAYHVMMDEGRATIELEGHHFHSPDAYGRIGENFARGSFDQDLVTRRYRFLLEGRLRPMDIAGWFREWWPDFFSQLEFPAAPPNASVDVAGVWQDSRQSAVFVFADAPKPVIRAVALDRVRTRLFIRPAFFDGLKMLATAGPQAVRGTFTYTADPATHNWQTVAVDLDSTLDLALAAKLSGPEGGQLLAPFKFVQPPAVQLKGRFDSELAPGGAHRDLQLTARTAGEFRFHDFPLEEVSFHALLHDDDLALDDVKARFAGGAATAHAKVFNAGQERRMSFDYTLTDANLGQAAEALQRYVAERNHRPPTPPGKFVQEKANVRVDLTGAAAGPYGDALGLHGEGTAVLSGAEIGEVPLLGALSQLLKFSALRFTSATANFKIDGPRLEFPQITLRGANSAIDAHGDYALDRRELDFKAKIFPFQQSGNLIKSVVGAVLSPISNAFEVKLTGTLAKPEWAFVIGPTNLIRSLAPGEAEAAKPPEAAAAPPPPPKT